MRRRVSEPTWREIRTAYASGIGLREIARNMDIPAGTILARSARESWSREIQSAKALAIPAQSSAALTPMQSAAMSIEARGRRHIERVAGIVEKTLPHVEGMAPAAILDQIDDIEKLDKIGRRTYGLKDNPTGGISLHLGISIGGMQ